MIRQMYTDMSEAELAAARPDPTAQLVSMGEHTRFDTEFGKHGRREVPVVYELFIEWKFGGGGTRYWHRYKDNPSVLVAQFDTTPAPAPVPVEQYSAEEIAAFKSMLPPKDVPLPETTQPLTVRPSW